MIDTKKKIEREDAIVTSMNEIGIGMMDVWIQSKHIAQLAKPGQFVSLYCNDSSRLLPRPISICEIDKKKNEVRLVFRVVGKGTLELAKVKAGDRVRIMGPLGNGFSVERVPAIIIGGGVGIPPLLELSKQLKADNITDEVKIILGYRDSQLFLQSEFEAYGEVFVATEDGSAGIKGNVMNIVENLKLNNDLIYACGPKPMLKAIKDFAQKNQIKAQISMEEKMACGIGACLVCVCKSTNQDDHSNVHNKRVCKDGPVFYSDEIEIDC
ncbi:MAG: dihydroorotate dehydrogenase electron transfer subunit [Velocimicrobium sp.]